MRAVDTNVLVRFIVVDDVQQADRVRSLVEACELFVPITVLLETEWVLRRSYRYDTPRIVNALRHFIGLPNVFIQHPIEVSQALENAAAGMELADAIHLALSVGCTDFVSFDRQLSRKASAFGAMLVVEP